MGSPVKSGQNPLPLREEGDDVSPRTTTGSSASVIGQADAHEDPSAADVETDKAEADMSQPPLTAASEARQTQISDSSAELNSEDPANFQAAAADIAAEMPSPATETSSSDTSHHDSRSIGAKDRNGSDAQRDADLPVSVLAPQSPSKTEVDPEKTQLPNKKGSGSSTEKAHPVQEADNASAHPYSQSPQSVERSGLPYTFSGVHTVIDTSKTAVTALSFATLDAELLAFGSDDGCLRVANLASLTPSILHETHDHQGTVHDVAWSHQDHQLISVSQDGLLTVNSHDEELWTTQRSLRTLTAALCCRFHPANQNLILVGTAGSTVEVFNTSTGLSIESCRAVLTSYAPEGVRAMAMDVSPDAVFVGDSLGYIHVLRLMLKDGQLQPLMLLGRIPPPGSQLVPLASLSFTSWSESVKGPALLAAGTDDMIAIYKIIPKQVSRVWIEKGHTLPLTARMGSKVRWELSSKHLMPQSARSIRASWCPSLPSSKPACIAIGGENAAVNLWDVSDSGSNPVPVNTLQAHGSPVVAIVWSADEKRLASSDVEGTIIVWKREHVESEPTPDEENSSL